MKSNAIIVTTDAKRIAKRLLNHWKHKFEVAETETVFMIFMPDAKLELITSFDQLSMLIETEREDYAFLENVVLEHINRMAQQQFEVVWSHQN